MKKKIVMVITVLGLLVTMVSTAIGTDDPLITESYLKNVFLNEVKEYIDGNSPSFTVASVEKGKVFTGDAGCEFILRQGKAEVIGAKLGGLSDVTGAVDITTGVPVPPNHLLIVPRDDGRGFKALTDVVIMVKGSYSVK
jgi:hypothetical protein